MILSEAGGEATAEGFVVEVESDKGDGQADSDGGQGVRPLGGHSGGDVGEADVGVEKVHHGIVDSVEGVAEVAQKGVETGGAMGGCIEKFAAFGGNPDEAGEEEKVEDDYIEAIDPHGLLTADEGHGKEDEKQEGTEEEGIAADEGADRSRTADGRRFSCGGGDEEETAFTTALDIEAGEKHAGAVGEEHSDEASPKVGKSPADAEVAGLDADDGEDDAADGGDEGEGPGRKATEE